MNRFVYVMSDGKNHKIGVSIDPISRLKAVQQESGKKIALLLTICCEDAYGCERELHRRFSEYNVEKEWFLFPDRQFLTTVISVCMEGLVSDEQFYAKEYLISQEAVDVEELISRYYVLTTRHASDILSSKYSDVVLPQIMKRLGCIQVTVSWSPCRLYITPLGALSGLSENAKIKLKEFVNKEVQQKTGCKTYTTSS